MQTIMAVDDSESIRQMVSFSLKMKNYNVMEAENGREACKKMEQCKADLLITDLDMPEMNGIELIRHMRLLPHYQNTPVIILTTHSDREMKQQAKDAGATAWITKPFRPSQLLLLVEKVL